MLLSQRTLWEVDSLVHCFFVLVCTYICSLQFDYSMDVGHLNVVAWCFSSLPGCFLIFFAIVAFFSSQIMIPFTNVSVVFTSLYCPLSKGLRLIPCIFFVKNYIKNYILKRYLEGWTAKIIPCKCIDYAKIVRNSRKLGENGAELGGGRGVIALSNLNSVAPKSYTDTCTILFFLSLPKKAFMNVTVCVQYSWFSIKFFYLIWYFSL